MVIERRRNKATERRRNRRLRGIKKGVKQAQEDAEREGHERVKRAERGLPKSAVPRFDPAGVEPEK